MAHSHTMIGGNGRESYSKNSTYQRALLEATKEKIDEAVSMKLDLGIASSHFNVADFGCSTGPNTFVAVRNIIDAVEHKFRRQTQQNPKEIEFQVFFNDHSNNDFNTLFKTLPPPTTREYFAVGVPGSFYSRVLPRNNLHLGHCSYSLHWLSQVPENVTEFNKDSIHCTGFVKEVTEAYLGQFKIDFGSFLDARAQELVSGGLLMLLGSCLPDGVQMSETMKGKIIDCAGSCLGDMAKSGLIEREKVESFNMPIYFAQESEFKQVIEKNGGFTIEKMERVSHENEEFPSDARFLRDSYRAAFGGVAEASFGGDMVDKMMDLFEEKVHEFIDKPTKAGMQFFVLLRRN
ncbi:PREDICTED: probable S-adenosylmethionine-dependent methyltransferase At5g38780 isoform X2 [Tarenaya hassleriana]|uniref:probable S-adenosylmethionine-dependent methyltransferase At5g38780 isoform X2 n=1 Tax=Tarenaya hassleriana TaxID=28532 RepID=UPI00053C9878|nr:PREDICTED: probable S-adenosylmethionine-dependent methyltransferase At5g38780 isoform X2 [Tarenaya hassleriana]